MKVYFAAQTLSSSVADALEFLKDAHVPGIQDADGKIVFICMTDRIFVLLNSQSRFCKEEYKQPVTKHSLLFWSEVVDTSASYLEELRDHAGVPMPRHL